MESELPLRWLQRDIQGDKGLAPKKSIVLQMKINVFSVKDALSITPGKPEPRWVDVPFVKAEDADGS